MAIISGVLGVGKFLGKELLRSAFPDVYNMGVRYRQAYKGKTSDKNASPTQQAVDQLNQSTVATNEILQSALEVQLVQTAVLEKILQNINSLQMQGLFNRGLPDVGFPDTFRRRPGPRPPRPKSGYTFDQKSGRYRNTRTGRYASPEEATGKKITPKKAPSAPRRGKSVADFLERFLKKRAPKLAAKIAARIGAGALAAGTGIGLIITLAMAVLTIWDIYDLYQLWEEYNNESEATETSKNIDKLLSKQDQQSGTITKDSIVFNGSSSIEFKAREMTIRARNLDIKGLEGGVAGGPQRSAIGTTPKEQRQAQQAREAAATRLAAPYQRAMERRQQAAAVGGAPLTPGGAQLPGGSTDAKQIPADVLAQAEQLIKSGRSSEIEDFMKQQGYPKPRQWCGAFVASVVKASGGDPKVIGNYNLASNWQLYGTSGGMLGENTPKPGDILASRVHTYGPMIGQPIGPGMQGGHVMIFKGVDPKTGKWIILSPNPARIHTINPNNLSTYFKNYEIRRAPEESQKVQEQIIPRIEQKAREGQSQAIPDSIANQPYKGYREGGIVEQSGPAMVGEDGPETIISGDRVRSSRTQAVENLSKGDIVVPNTIDELLRQQQQEYERGQSQEARDVAAAGQSARMRGFRDRGYTGRMEEAGVTPSENIIDRRNLAPFIGPEDRYNEAFNQQKEAYERYKKARSDKLMYEKTGDGNLKDIENRYKSAADALDKANKQASQYGRAFKAETYSFGHYRNKMTNLEMIEKSGAARSNLAIESGIKSIPQVNYNPWTGKKLGGMTRGGQKIPEWQERENIVDRMYLQSRDNQRKQKTDKAGGGERFYDSTNIMQREFNDNQFF